MPLELTADERAMLAGRDGPAVALALRVLAERGALAGADRLIPVVSAHVGGGLDEGDAGVAFAERLQAAGGRVRIPATLDLGALDRLHPDRVRAAPHRRDVALRLMQAHESLGCRPTWTSAPHQSGHRPRPGQDVAWSGASAVVFANSVLGARTERCGDFVDICAGLVGRAPRHGLHLAENRRARILVETAALPARLRAADAFFAVLGSWLGHAAGRDVAVIAGLAADTGEDQLKALGAAAAAGGTVGLFHVAGVTPEAPSAVAALGGEPPEATIRLTPAMIRAARDRLTTAPGEQRLDAIALGVPHFSLAEFAQLLALLRGRRTAVPFYVCTGRAVVEALRRDDRLQALDAAGIVIVADTCVAAAPILPAGGGVLMTSSGSLAQDAPGRTGYGVVFGSLEDCVASAVAGRVCRDEQPWA